ncbi:carbonic anhydrase 4-like [Pseudorasbora parva]|uniref:carbonic anhydrase 4-like n=1 Tax=Pseudorasbora parva TaxID=51549 RepID=UPI00351E6843
MMNAFVACLTACLWLGVSTDPTSEPWCYNRPSCSDVTWPTIASKDCNGTQQSPIDIVIANVQPDANLTSFKFTGYDDQTVLTEIKNTGTTIDIRLDHTRVNVEGGDLPGLFVSRQIHFHWGNSSAFPGSEHTVDGKRYPMELHVVNEAVRDGSMSGNPALAVLGVFIEASNDTGKPTSWKRLTSYLKKITNAGDKALISHNISMDDLLSGVDRTKYYRYLGSLTTPNCTEGVLWTIFKEPVKVSQDLLDLFTTTVYINQTNSPLMTNTFRGVQPINGRVVRSQVAGTSRSTGPLTLTSTAKPTTLTATAKLTTPKSAVKPTTLTSKPTTTTSTAKPTTPTSPKSNAAKPTTPHSNATNLSQALMCPLLSLALLFCILPFF